METKLLIIIGIILGVGVLLILSLNALSDIRKQECKADGGVVIGPFSCVISHADYDAPLTRYDLKKDCNSIDGRTEAQCFKDALESCTAAITNDVIYTIEGDAMYLEGIIQEDCKIHITFDNSGDKFGGSDKGIQNYICDRIELQEKHIWIIDNCTGETEFQINYEAQDYASQEKCTNLGGEWSYEFHNCVVLDTNSEPVTPPLQIKVVGENQVRRGTTQSIEIQVVRGSSPIEGARVFIDIEDYGEDLIKEFDGYTNSEGYFVFSWEIPQSFDDVETLLAFIDVTDGISSKTELFKFQVYCLPGEKNCKAEGN